MGTATRSAQSSSTRYLKSAQNLGCALRLLLVTWIRSVATCVRMIMHFAPKLSVPHKRLVGVRRSGRCAKSPVAHVRVEKKPKDRVVWSVYETIHGRVWSFFEMLRRAWIFRKVEVW